MQYNIIQSPIPSMKIIYCPGNHWRTILCNYQRNFPFSLLPSLHFTPLLLSLSDTLSSPFHLSPLPKRLPFQEAIPSTDVA